MTEKKEIKVLDEIIDKYSVDLDEVIECPKDCCGCTCFQNPPCDHCVNGHGLTRREAEQ